MSEPQQPWQEQEKAVPHFAGEQLRKQDGTAADVERQQAIVV
jgi:hypothetical protein